MTAETGPGTDLEVLLTTDYLPPSAGGVERVATELALELDAAGVDVTILALEEAPERLAESGVRVVTVGSYDLTDALGIQARVSLEFPIVLLRLLWRESFDIVHVHNRFFFSSWIVGLLWWILPSPARLITTIHLGDVDDIDGFAGLGATLIERTLGAVLVNQSDLVIGVSGAAVQAANDLGSTTRTEVVYNGVDTEQFTPGTDDARPFTVLFVGRLISNKGIMELLEAMAGLEIDRDWQLTVVGSGPLEAECAEFVAQHEFEGTVEFKGFVESVADEMANSDVFCRPSQTEGFPLTLLEAMASGLPAVVTPVGGVGEVVEPDDNGVVVDQSPENIRASIRELATDERKRTELSRRARETAVGDYSWESRAASVLDCYREVADSAE